MDDGEVGKCADEHQEHHEKDIIRQEWSVHHTYTHHHWLLPCTLTSQSTHTHLTSGWSKSVYMPYSNYKFKSMTALNVVSQQYCHQLYTQHYGWSIHICKHICWTIQLSWNYSHSFGSKYPHWHNMARTWLQPQIQVCFINIPSTLKLLICS